MAFTLTDSVGRMGGVNREDDVRKVQNALNKVPVGAGRPPQRLEPDGKCGPKTIEAIQLFQIKHFGWGGADGRVDVNGPTHQKLNQFDGPVVATVESSQSFTMRIETGPSNLKPRDVEWRLLFTDEANETSRVYRLVQDTPWKQDKPQEWGKAYPLHMDTPMTAADFHDAKFGYRSTLIYDPKAPFKQQRNWINVMVLQLSGSSPKISPHTPTKIFECLDGVHENPNKAGTYQREVRGQLKLVETIETARRAGTSRILSENELQQVETELRMRRRT